MTRSIVVIGGAQGGPTAAARARAFDENARITLIEREPQVSWVQAGLREQLEGNVPRIKELDKDRAEFFDKRHRIEVRTNSEAIAIDVDARRVHVRNKDGVERVPFDAVIFSGGAGAIFPDVDGLRERGPGVVTFRKRSDLNKIKALIENGAKRALVLGCGPIGLNAAEGLRAAGLKVEVVERSGRILPTLSLPAARAAAQILQSSGTVLHTGDDVKSVEQLSNGSSHRVTLVSGKEVEADIIVVAIGMQPRTRLLERAGASLNTDGSVRVDPQMSTTLPNVFACGTAVCVPHAVTRSHLWLPQAAIADRTAQIAGRSAACPHGDFKERLSPVAGTALHQVGEFKFGRTGLSDAEARSHCGPDNIEITTAHSWTCEEWFGERDQAKDICVRMIVDKANDVVVGGEVWGTSGVPRRLDLLAAAVIESWPPSRVASLDVAYTPDIGPALDPVNAAGAMSALVMQNEAWPIEAQGLALRLAQNDGTQLVDVSRKGTPEALPEGTLHIPLEEMRDRLDEIKKDCDVVLFSQTGRRAHQASRILRQRGFERAFHLDGGTRSWSIVLDKD